MVYRTKIRIYSKIFDIILNSLKDAFEEDCFKKGKKKPENIAEYYGFSKQFSNHQQPLSLYHFILEERKRRQKQYEIWRQSKEDEEILSKKYIGSKNIDEPIHFTKEELKTTFSTKYLYDLMLEAKDAHPYRTIDFNEVYLNLCLKSIGYKDLSEFLDTNCSTEDIHLQLSIMKTKKGEISSNATEYEGYYFTNQADLNSETFKLYMDLKNRYEESKFPVKLEDFHKTDERDSDHTIYEGRAIAGKTFTHMELKETSRQNNYRPLHIFCYKKHSNIEDLKWIHVLLSGISKKGMPIALEAIIVQKDYVGRNKPYFDAYLQLRRNNIRLPERTISNPKELKSRLTLTPAKDIVILEGTYRVWNFLWNDEQGGGIMQSRLTIHRNFKSDIETFYEITKGSDRNKQHCVMSISTVGNGRKKLCLASHTPTNDGFQVLNYAIFDIHEVAEEKDISTGVFCGQQGANTEDDNISLAAEWLVFMKDQSQFPSDRLYIEDVKLLLRQDDHKSSFKEMLIKLFEAYGINQNNYRDNGTNLQKGGKRDRFLSLLRSLYSSIFDHSNKDEIARI
ncbi:MAG: hypothetical protein AAF849_13205 [Bacteroidota bacterium]